MFLLLLGMLYRKPSHYLVLESASAKDPVLQAVMSAIRTGCWHKAPFNLSLSELSRDDQLKEQLTCTDTVLLKSDRIVVPASLTLLMKATWA